MKRGFVWLMAVLLWLPFVPSMIVSAAAEPTAFPLTTYADRVKLLGDITPADGGLSATAPLDGIAFYSRGGDIALTAWGNATLTVFVDARYYDRVSVADGERTAVADLPEGPHRVELFLDSGEALLTAVYAVGEIAPVPKTPRQMAFQTTAYTVREMAETAHAVGMDVKTSADETTDIVVVDNGSESELAVRYPHARIVCVGDTALPFTYRCEKTALDTYLIQTAVPETYPEEIAAYVALAQRQLSDRPPAKPLAERLQLEIDIAKANDGVSGVLFSLYGEVSNGPFSAKLPKRAEPIGVNTFILTAVLTAVTGGTLLTAAWVCILKKTKPTVDDHEKQEEESL